MNFYTNIIHELNRSFAKDLKPLNELYSNKTIHKLVHFLVSCFKSSKRTKIKKLFKIILRYLKIRSKLFR